MARAAIVTELAEAPAYMTTSAEAQKFEDELEQLGPGASRSRPAQVVEHVRSLDAQLAKLAVPFEEWETLYRMRLQLERDALAGTPLMESGSEVATEEVERPPRVSRLDLGIALGTAALVVADRRVVARDAAAEGQKHRLRKWSGRRDSNPRHPAWKAGALPLNYSRSLGCLRRR